MSGIALLGKVCVFWGMQDTNSQFISNSESINVTDGTCNYHWNLNSGLGYVSEVHPVTCYEDSEEEWRYISTLALTSWLDRGWVASATPRPLYPRKRDPVSIVQWLGGSRDRSGRVCKISPLQVFDPQTFTLSESGGYVTYTENTFVMCRD